MTLVAENAHGFLGVPSLVWQLLNLGLFLGLLWYFLRKPAADFFGNRKADVAKALAKADEDRRRAEELAKELQARLASIETELRHLKDAARRDDPPWRDPVGRLPAAAWDRGTRV